MKALNFTEIYLNHRVYTGPWVVPAGTYTVNFQGASLFEVTDIHDCALLCRSCWYFGIMDNKCINISSLFHHPDESSDNHTIDLYSSNSGEVLETTVPSAGVDCVQVTIKMEVFPVSYSLSVKDCEESLTALCLRANDSTYVTSQTQLNFTGSKKFCNDEGAILASSFSNRYLYESRITSGTYWTPITRKNELRRKVCPDDAYPGGYCRKMFLNGTIVTMNCTEKSYSICVKEKVTTTTSTTTTSKAAPPSTTSLALTTATTESHVIRVNYSIMVIQGQNYNQTAIQCQQSYGSLWNYDLPDIYVTNVSQILKTKELGETWTNYGLFFSKWIIQTVYSGGLLKHFLNVTIYAEGAYHCASKCMDFPNFIPLKNECQCLSDSTNVSEYSENTTVVMYSTINDVEIEAEELKNEDRQCVVASVNFKVFPMSYTLRGALCDEIHHVICQTFNDTVIGYIHLANTTYNAAVEACSNLSATIFNPRDYNPALLSNILNSNKTETIWTAISREFFWRNLIDTQDYFERLKRPVCRVLWSNGTLESRSCSERSSALCFINRDGEKITKIPTISTVSSGKDSENVTEIPKNSTISGTGTYNENVTTTPTNPNIQGAGPHNPQAEHLPLYIVLPCGAIVILVIVLGVVIYIKRVQLQRKNGNTPENNSAEADDVKSNIYGTIPKTMNDGVLRTDEQCEADVLGMNGFSGGFYNSGIAEYSMVNKIPRPIKIQSNSDETNSSKPMNYGYQETDDYGDREEDNLEMSIFSDDTNIVNPRKDVYSVVDKNRQRTDPNQDGSYKEDSDKLPVFRHPTMYNEDTFSRRKFGERSGIYKL